MREDRLFVSLPGRAGGREDSAFSAGRRTGAGASGSPFAALSASSLHEIVPAAPADGAAACGFALALAARFLRRSGRHGLIVAEDFALLETGAFYGPGLAAFGLDLERLLFVRAPDARAAFAAMEEGLKSGALAFALGEIWDLKGYTLTVSRRLLLAAQKGATPALLVQASAFRAADRLSSAAATRIEIAATPSRHGASAGGGRGLPGPPTFSARLVKARLGQGPPAALDPDRAFLVAWRGDTRDFDDDFDAPTMPEPLAPPSADRPRAAAGARRAG